MPAASWIQHIWQSPWQITGVGLLAAGTLAVGVAAPAHGQTMTPSYMPYGQMAAAPVAYGGYGGYGAVPAYGAVPTYGYYNYGYAPASPWVQPAMYAPHGGLTPCPCPQPPQIDESTGTGTAPEGTDDDTPVPSDEAELPEVADLSSDASFASADQSAAPNMIGDTIGFGGTGYLVITDGFTGDALSVSPGAGRKFKAGTNNSPVPQTRAFYNFHYFDNALTAISDTSISSTDVKRHEAGFEYAFWSNLASVMVTIPASWSIDSTIIQPTGVIPTPHDTELGNISVAFKGVLYQTCYTTMSVGLGIDLPTADDVYVDNGLTTFSLSNDTVTLSPFVGVLWQPTCNTFVQSFVQTALPMGENDIEIGGVYQDDIKEMTLLYLDTSLGAWLYQDGCGNGIAALGELHFSTTIGDEEEVFFDDGFVQTAFIEDNWKALHATAGFAGVYNCWSIAPAIVLPLFNKPDRFFDWEATIQVNRRF